MLLIIPSIDIHHGSCRRCIEGAPGMESLYAEYSHHPERLVQLWRRENAKSLHITDFDAMFEHNPDFNNGLISSMIKATDIPIQLLSSFPDIEHCSFWLEQGLYRVIINEVMLTDPAGVKALIKQYTPSRVVAAIRVSSDRVTLPDMECGLDVKETINLAQSLGMNRIMYADTSWEGTLHGPDLAILKNIAQYSSMRITVGGGIGGPEQLWALQELRSFGIDSVVIGRALYENKFPCQEMWRSIEAQLEPDIS